MNAIPRRLNKYELYKQLGRGNTGEVWQGYDLQARQKVAVKLLYSDLLQSDPAFVSLFIKNWQPVIALQHPNIVRVREVNISRTPASAGTTPYVVMDYVEGQITLAEGIRRTSRAGRFPDISDIVHIFWDLGQALDYALAQGIVHGNIKPTNILLDMHSMIHAASTEALLTDFGITSLPGNKQRTAPYYLSPEQVRGVNPDARSDVYALGVILYEMCTGVLPFPAESHIAVMRQHRKSLPTAPTLINAHIPAALSEVILRAMAKEALTRFASAAQLAAAIAMACGVEQAPQGLHARTRSSFVEVARSQPHTQSNSGPLPVPFALSRQSREMATILGVAGPSAPPVSAKQPAMKIDTAITPTAGRLSQEQLDSGPLALPYMQPVDVVQASPQLAENRIRYSPAHTLSPLVVMIVLLCLLLVVVGSLGFILVRYNGARQANVLVSNADVGHAFFLDDPLGHDDTLRLQMQDVPAPPQGKRYFAWLQNTGGQAVPLGPLSIQNGTTTLTYLGDGKHTNLLSIVQGLFVTQENAGQSTPQAPSSRAKIYQANFSGSSFQYVQHILYVLPGFPVHTSLIAGLFDTIGGMNDKAGSVVDSLQGTHDYGLAARQAQRILEQIDGSHSARASGDLPASQPLLLNVPVGLLSFPARMGYIDTLAAQADKVMQTAGADTDLRQHAQNVSKALQDLHDWMQRIRGYARQILKSRDLGAAGVFSAALQLRQLAQDSYTGLTIPPNPGPLPILGSAGVYQAAVECQYLATLNIKKIA